MMHPRLVRCALFVLILWPLAAGTLQGQDSLGPAHSIPDEPFCSPRFPELAALPDGGLWAVWSEEDPESGAFRLLSRELGADARPRNDVSPLDPLGPNGVRPLAAVASDGTRVAVWNDGEGFVRARGFAPDGSPLGPSFRLFRSEQPPESLSAGPDGRFMATGLFGGFSAFAARFDADGSGDGLFQIALGGAPTIRAVGTILTGGTPVMAVQQDPTVSPTEPLQLWRLGPGGGIVPPIVEIPTAFEPALAALPDGELLLVYRGGREVVAEIRRADLSLVSSFELAGIGFPQITRPPSLAVAPDGESFVIAWPAVTAPPMVPSDEPPLVVTQVLGQRYGLDGTRRGFPELIASFEGEQQGVLTTDLAFTTAGHFAAAWWVPVSVLVTPVPPCSESAGAFARSTAPSCGGDPETTLCLQDHRFALTVDWHDPRSGDAGTGHPVDLTGDTGAFWFFDEDNLEMMVKVIDGRPVNGHFWLFYGSLTDVELTLTVTDRDTGIERTFTKPPFVFASEGDTTAFPVP